TERVISMPHYFIDRPIFDWVLAILVMLMGGLAILGLPVNQYPSIAPPAVNIAVNYPGASAKTVQDTVAQVIEQQMNGIDGLRYMTSESGSDGSMSINVTFDQGVDPDISQVQAQNKLPLATLMLSQEVQQLAIRVSMASSYFLMIVGLISIDGRMGNE